MLTLPVANIKKAWKLLCRSNMGWEYIDVGEHRMMEPISDDDIKYYSRRLQKAVFSSTQGVATLEAKLSSVYLVGTPAFTDHVSTLLGGV